MGSRVVGAILARERHGQAGFGGGGTRIERDGRAKSRFGFRILTRGVQRLSETEGGRKLLRFLQCSGAQGRNRGGRSIGARQREAQIQLRFI